MLFYDIVFLPGFHHLMLMSALLLAIVSLKILFNKMFFLLPALFFVGQLSGEQRIAEQNNFAQDEHAKHKWKKLFNGKDFSGWETHLSKPHPSAVVPGMKKDNNGNYLQRIGMNNDPLKVFNVTQVDGAPAIFITGQVFGCIATQESFSNFRLRLQFKWGQKKWPPRENDPRDSGVLYFSIGKPGEGSENWMVSQECQIQERDCGDFWKIGPTVIDIPARAGGDKERHVYDPNGNLVSFGVDQPAGTSCAKFPDNEKPTGEWNTVEIYCFNGNSVHVVNGAVVMRLFNSRVIKDGKEQPLTAGKIQLQSECAEVYYRNIEILPLEKMPPIMKEYRLAKKK
jgi:hypothetical protein